MRILLTGATGFIGRHMARVLVQRGHFVSCLVRLGSERRLHLPDRARSERVSGDLTDADSLGRKPLGCEALVNLAGITREVPVEGQTFARVHVDGLRNLLASCLESGVGRVVHVSALAAAPDAVDPYRRSKGEGEAVVRSFPIPWTILRPALVYGPGSPTLAWMRRLTLGSPLLPVPVFAGATRISPIWVDDLAAAVAACLERPATIGATHDAGGPETVTVSDLVAAIARTRGVAHWQVGLSANAARSAARLAARFPWVPEPPGALDLLGVDHVADPRPLVTATGVVLTPLADGLRFTLRRPSRGG
jgi:NADH dehydrogenase